MFIFADKSNHYYIKPTTPQTNMKALKFTLIAAFIIAAHFSYSQCGVDSVEVIIRVHTDNYGSETTWELKHASGSPVYINGGPYPNVSGGVLYTHNVCVPEDTPLVFRIDDAYGDGICCTYGNGYYEVVLFGYIFASGGEFGSYEETFFSASYPPQTDMGVTAIEMFDYYGIGPISIEGSVKNFGFDTITEYTINYSVNGGSAESHTFSTVNILPFEVVDFTHPTPFSATASGTYNIKVWTSDVNQAIDENNDNDTLYVSTVVVSEVPQKYVLIEQATGAWCGFCPDGSVRLEQILSSNPFAIPAAIHSNDAMTFSDGNIVNSSYAGGFPSGYIDRYKFSDASGVGLGRGIWSSKTNERMSHVVPASVEVSNTYNPTTREVNIEVSATFYVDLDEEIRFNCYIVEDSLTGTGSGWNQANSYNNTSGHPMQGMGNPIVGYVHRHVLMAMLGGPFGTASSLPANITDGQTYTQQYTYTLPPGMKEKDVRIIGMVKQYNANTQKRAILNSKQVLLDGISRVASLGFVDKLDVYPNPAISNVNIDFSITESRNTEVMLYNMLGQKVHAALLGRLSGGVHSYSVNTEQLAPGLYNIIIRFDNEQVSRKLIVH